MMKGKKRGSASLAHCSNMSLIEFVSLRCTPNKSLNLPSFYRRIGSVPYMSRLPRAQLILSCA